MCVCVCVLADIAFGFQLAIPHDSLHRLSFQINQLIFTVQAERNASEVEIHLLKWQREKSVHSGERSWEL